MRWAGGLAGLSRLAGGTTARMTTVRTEHGQASAALPLDAMPCPRGLPLLGSTLSLIAAGSAPRLHEYVDMRHRQLGPVFRDRIGPVSAVFVADPVEMRRTFGLEGKYPIHVLPEPWVLYNQLYGCKRGLFFMDGEDWLQMRRVMNKLMLRPEQADIFEEPCKIVADSLASKWKSRGMMCIQDLEGQLYKWSLDTVIAVMTGSLYKLHAERWEKDVENLSSNIHKIFLESGRMSLISAKYARVLHLPVWKRFVETVDTSLSTARALVLDMISVCSSASDGLLGDMVKAGVSQEDIIKIVVDFVIAAGDTTALSLQWTLYLLAKNKDVQETLAAEICEEKDIMKSVLIRGVIREALRLYPVAPFLTRVMPEPCILGGYRLPSMTLVLLSLFTAGRDSANFPAPDRFWPQRWLRGPSTSTETPGGVYQGVINPNASIPFAIGSRSCIGRKMAETQMVMTVGSLLREFKIELLNTSDVDMILRLVAVPSKPIKIRLSQRAPVVA